MLEALQLHAEGCRRMPFGGDGEEKLKPLLLTLVLDFKPCNYVRRVTFHQVLDICGNVMDIT